MKAKEAIDLAKFRIKNMAGTNDPKLLLHALNLALNDLYARFNLRIKSETVLVHRDIAIYELRNDDVNMLLTLYNEAGVEFTQTDVLQSDRYGFKILNFRTFMLRHRFDGYVYAIYKASPVKIVDPEDELDIPDCMIAPLTTYIAYLVESITSTVGKYGQVKEEPSFYYKIYEKECMDLVNRGYVMPLDVGSLAIQAKGFQ